MIKLPEYFYIQYQNATNFGALLNELTNYLTIDLDSFYRDFFDIRTCNTNGLNNWGLILNQNRNIPNIVLNGIFGFVNKQGDPHPLGYPENFNHGQFYNPSGGEVTQLSNRQYRPLLLLTYAKYSINNSIGSIAKSINLYAKFKNSNYNVTVSETKDFTINYKFNYSLESWEIFLFTETKFLPTPAGINYEVEYIK